MKNSAYLIGLILVLAIGTNLIEVRAEDPGSVVDSSDSDLLPEITEYTIQRDVPYAQDSNPRHLMNTYIPEGAGPFPAFVYIHGGAWVGGHRDVYDVLGPFYAKRGIAGFSIDYTLATPSESSWPQAINDVRLAIRHIRESAMQYRIDPGRVAVMGHSAGGHLASLVGTLSGNEPFLEGTLGNTALDRVSLVMDYFGPTDFQFVGERGQSFSPYGAIQMFLGDVEYEANPDRWIEASPATYITSDDPVFVIAHGTNDDVVQIAISESFKCKLEQASVETHFVRVEGGGHGFSDEENLQVRHVLEPLLRRVFDLQPPNPSAELKQLKTYINSLPLAVFNRRPMSASKMKQALSNKIDEAILKVGAGNYSEAIDKLRNDVRAKTDGDSAAGDWIVDPATQLRLCIIIDHIIESIQILQQDS